MKRIVIFSICFLMMWIQNVDAQSSGSRYDRLKDRLQRIENKLRTASGARRRSLLRQKFLVRARLARLSKQVCEERPDHSPITNEGSGCDTKPRPRPRPIVQQYQKFPKVNVVCPQDRKFGSSYNRKTNVLTIKVCNGLDGKSPKIKGVEIVPLKRGEKPRAEYKDSKLILHLPKPKDGKPGDKIDSVEVVPLASDEKPSAEYKDGKLTLYLPEAKEGPAGRDGQDGQTGKDGDRILPDWLKIYAGGFYFLTRGLRHNFGGMVGMGFVLVPKRLDLLIEGGLGYEAHFRMLSGYVKGGLGINFHPMVGMNISAFGNWNLNYRNLAEFEALGGTLGVHVLIAKHFRISADLFLGQLRWPDENGVHKTFGVGGKFTFAYQF